MVNEKKHKHLTPEDREEIQGCLDRGMTFKAIGRRIGKDQTTVAKEVKKHIKVQRNAFVREDACCPLLLKPPYVCNGCPKRSRSNCHYERHTYFAKEAQSSYRELLTDAREGVALNRESFYQTDKIIAEGSKNGQSIYHIIKTHDLPISRSTVYRNIKKGYSAVSIIDLPRAVKFKPRRANPAAYVPKKLRVGRTYDDFLTYKEDHKLEAWVEMDSLIGRLGGKIIVTFHFTVANFMFGLLADNKSATEVASRIAALKEKLRASGFHFGGIFPVLLTDNGGEFSAVCDIEHDGDDAPETRLFFCDPNMPSQKPHIEKNHTLFRSIVPSGRSFDSFTQDTVNLIFSHVNAVKRAAFNGKSAYELFAFTYTEQLINALGIRFIDAKQVVQSPKLIGG